jgi:hypothetical protein
MSTDWKTLRAALPQDVRLRLDEKRDSRRLGEAALPPSDNTV